MMMIQLGPLAFSVQRFSALLAILVLVLVAGFWQRRRKISLEGPALWLLLVSLVVGRAAFVAQFWSAYQGDVIGWFDIRDGGFSVPAVLVGAALVLAVYWVRNSRQALHLTGISLVALVAWFGSLLGLGYGYEPPHDWPDVTLYERSMEARTLADVHQGRPLVVNVWATWCAPCVRELPVLQAAADEHEGIDFVFLNAGEDWERIDGFLERQGLSVHPIMSDPSNALSRAYGSQGLPTTLFYRADGSLLEAKMGEISHATLMQQLERL
ncbi:MAG: TlpA family protein disulfide reductase [Saccharospirillum sp.]